MYVEIAKFNKTEEELDTLYDKWLYDVVLALYQHCTLKDYISYLLPT